MDRARVTHVALVMRSVGGIEAVLRQHHTKDEAYGIDSEFIVLTEESEQAQLERVHCLGFSRMKSIRRMQDLMSSAMAGHNPEVVLYHGGAMRLYCCEVDRAARRILFLHGIGTVRDTEEALKDRVDWLDGVLSVNQASADLVRRLLPAMTPERLAILPLPLNPRPLATQAPNWGARPLVLGYCGRLMRQHKRVDRLPAFCTHLDSLKVDYRMEVLGDGPESTWLKRQLAGNPRVTLHGRKQGDEYWKSLGQWDGIVFFSDTEGQPVALLEALSCGVIPVFPRIGSGGDPYVEKVDERLLYEPGGIEQAARIVAALSSRPASDLETLRNRCREAVAHHLDDAYFKLFSAYIRRIRELPRISQDHIIRRPAAVDHVPTILLTPLALGRRWVLRQFRRTKA
jgi:glycosyltransferase involved in cell wall biosynthesis